MDPEAAIVPTVGPASLIVVGPHGQKKRVPVDQIPFFIGRQPDNHLILRDTPVSRVHARILVEDGGYVLEDIGSRPGTFINRQRVTRNQLSTSDQIEFAAPDSYHLLLPLASAAP